MDNRSRFVRICDKIVVTNYKCGYSSLNKLKISDLNPKNIESLQKIMIYRKTLNRIISCFCNWGIRILTIENGENSWLFSIIKEQDLDIYKEFIYLAKNTNEENIIKQFLIFVNLLDRIYLKNEHLHPQVLILKKYKIKPDIFINLDNTMDMKYFKDLIGQDIPKSNISNNKNKDILFDYIKKNKDIESKILQIYNDDEILFSSINEN